MNFFSRSFAVSDCHVHFFSNDLRRLSLVPQNLALVYKQRGYSSVVEQSTADRYVLGSNPSAPSKKSGMKGDLTQNTC